MTGDQRRAFEQQWPGLASALHQSLSCRGIPKTDRDDLVQETAFRLIRIWNKLDHSRPLYPLAYTVTRNLVRDRARRHPEREVILGELPEMPASADVERESLGRLDLQRVARAMQDLSRPHRLVLLQEVDEDSQALGRGPDATKMLRMRARRRLTTLLQTASAAAGLIVLKLRKDMDTATQAAVGAVAIVAVAATLQGGALPEAPRYTAPSVAGEHVGGAGLHRNPSRVADLERVAVPHGRTPSITAVGTSAQPTTEPEPPRPVTVPIGDDAEVEAQTDINVNGMHVEVSDRGGPVPACAEGVPGIPGDLTCGD